MGYLVGTIGIVGAGMILASNDRWGENIPWSVPITILFLWLFVKYMRGAGPPSVTAAARREAISWNPLTSAQWKWAGVGCLAIFLFVPASAALTFRFVELSPGLLDRSSEIQGMPLSVAIIYIAMIALTAGVVE